jgi:hypothetical protein
MSHATSIPSSDGTLLFSLVLEAKLRAYNETLPREDRTSASTDTQGNMAANVLQAIRNPYSLVRHS